MILLNKKVIITLLCILVSIIIISEYSNGREKRSFFTFSATEKADIEYVPHFEDSIQPIASLLPRIMLEAELDLWLEQQKPLEQLILDSRARSSTVPGKF